MRKITREAVNAFVCGRDFHKGNMAVEKRDGLWTMYLHGNAIAQYREDGLWICNGGWSSVTTKERLNGLDGVSVYQKDWQWYLNGKEWDGKWVRVFQKDPCCLLCDTGEVHEH